MVLVVRWSGRHWLRWLLEQWIGLDKAIDGLPV